ncbi:phage major capsid protein [Dyadobacter sandarakinus]|uniref:Phage major capsid protein n=1 Tax=Dyadobacter sandarakinus TaxID=2747268 RepID=A0ABX7I0Y3_9BACT|nr:phage major capsid protein [Dyadobacter sandarakinus]QRQ99710.1 phage major capsid protein [Dyadobacter sandarakinus]
MKTLREVQEERNQKVADAQALLDKAKSEKRELSDDEQKQFDALLEEKAALEKQIENKRKQEDFAAQRAMTGNFNVGGEAPKESKDEKNLRNYSVLKMIRSQVDQKPLDGVEKEVHEEGVKEAKELGQEIRGFAIPSRLISKRDNSVTMPTQPEDGAAVVSKDVRDDLSILDMLRNALVTRQLGCTYLNDLVGNVAFTRLTQRPVASWKPEVGALDKSNVKFAADELSPKRLGTYTIQSLQFIRQTAPSVERQIREEIAYAISEGVDIAAISGTGTNNQPTGILNHTGVASINVSGLGTNGGPLTRANIITLRTALLKRNIRGRRLAWLLNAATQGSLANTPIATGSDKFILEGDNLLGYPVVMSNMVPSDLDKGSASDSLSAMIFGDWSELYIAQWGGIDILTDPYTLAVDGQVKIVAQGFFNVLVHRPEAFAYYKDIVTT